MNASLATAMILTGTLLVSGCATKKYVRNTTAPIQSKVDQVGEQTTRNAQGLEETRTQVKQVDERAQTGISAAQERAATAETRAGEAMASAKQAGEAANQAQQAANKNTQEISGLRGVIANLDDYKLQTSVSVPFKFNRYSLDDESKLELDKLAGDVKNGRRYFVAVEGYTDATGSPEYNAALSRRRADAVVQYLVAKHGVPIYRIHMIGLGEQKPADEGKGRDARAKNRRVEVKVFNADQSGVSADRAAPSDTARTSGVAGNR